MKTQLEDETGATITLPRKGAHASGEITIKGPTYQTVDSARTRVELLIHDMVSKKYAISPAQTIWQNSVAL